VHGLQHYGAMLQLFVYARQAFHEQMHSHPTEMEKLLQAKFLFNYSNCFLGVENLLDYMLRKDHF